jgi:cytochrome c553
MRRVVWLVGACAVFVLSVGVESRPQGSVNPEQLAAVPQREPAWAFPVQAGTLPAEAPGAKTVPGSSRSYTPEQIDNLLTPPDWFPNDHGTAPSIVTTGHAGALACGSCHLMSGIGHPESADVSGLSAQYFIQQMNDFKSGARKDLARMNGIAKEVSDEEIRQAADYFASLKLRKNNRVVEADMAPKTFIGQGRMRFVDPAGGMEPTGQRILTVPVDIERARWRDPATEFVSYVPPGTLARGKALVDTGDGGKTVACGTCHGANMLGQGTAGLLAPRLAGVHPIYLVRQMYLFKDGSRAGATAALMTPVVANLSDGDVLAIAAYLASLDPTTQGTR